MSNTYREDWNWIDEDITIYSHEFSLIKYMFMHSFKYDVINQIEVFYLSNIFIITTLNFFVHFFN